MATLKEKLDLELSEKSINRKHRIGTATLIRIKPRPIIGKFVSYADRNKVFTNKKRLNNTEISITESLTARRTEYLKKLMQESGFKNVWVADRRIIYFEETEKIF